ncbi:rhomboid family intramembrane serine protease [Celeribacter arenosi]|uniref:Rhomboid family intramembrane serine protease n=1 Tax=Celeribacter arenosi TaxID=792649 RepID=A0ABP7K4W4_9RHOB
MSDLPESPFNALPPAVWALVIVITGIELLFQVGSYGIIGGPNAVGWRIHAMETYTFFDVIFEEMMLKNYWPFEHAQRFFTYAFVHASMVHALMVAVFVLAFGKMVGERFGNIAVIALFVVSTLAGSLAYGLILDSSRPLVGGYPAAFGFLGAYTFLLWVGLGAMGKNAFTAFRLIGFLVAIRLIFAIFNGLPPDLVADIAGFAAGFVLAAAMVPGAIPRLFQRIRQR